MPRIQGLTESGYLTTSKLLKTGPGQVFSISMGWAGSTAGKLCCLRDGEDAGGALLVVFPVPTANGFISREWSQGKVFANGLYFDKATLDGSVWVEITFK